MTYTFYASMIIGLLTGIALGLMVMVQGLKYRERKYRKLWETGGGDDEM